MRDEEPRDLKLAELNLPPAGTTGAHQFGASPREFPTEPAEEYKAEDLSRSLWVTVGKDGKILRLEVSSGWHTRLPAAEFAGALVTAYMSASETAAVVESRARERDREQLATTGTESAGDLPGLDEWLAGMQTRQARLDSQLREARTEDEDAARQEREIHSPRGYLTLRVRSGALIGLAVDAERISRVAGDQLRQDLWDGFTAAGLTSPGLPAAAARPGRRPAPDEEDEDLWKGMSWQ